MKKPLLLSAIALACGAACAQSSVTLYGVADVGIQRTLAGGAGAVTAESNGGLATSRLGFRGNEDLGGGWGAGFWLEASLNPDVGTGRSTNVNNQPNGTTGGGAITFDRMSFVSLHGPLGEIRLGHDFVPTHYNSIYFDPFNANGVARAGNFTFTGVGSGILPTAIVASNTISWWLPHTLGGLYGVAMVGVGENASNAPNANDGNLAGARLGFARGPFDIAAAVMHTRYAPAATIGNYTHENVGASWNAGFAKLFALYNRVSVQLAGGEVRKNTAMIGAHVPVGHATKLRVSYARLDDDSAAGVGGANGSAFRGNNARQWGIGFVHDLSRRTALYGTYARLNNRGAATYAVSGGRAPLPGEASTGFEVGVRHSF